LAPVLAAPQAPHPWQMLWGAYRAHALTLAGRVEEALTLARMLVPADVYEWTHVFECLLRAGRLGALDMSSFLYRPAHAGGHRWADLARQRMRADSLRRSGKPPDELGETYRALVEEYDRGGLPWERALTRLSRARWLESRGEKEEALALASEALQLGRRYGMRVIEADALALAGQEGAGREVRRAIGYEGPARP
jgi:hypothetical protein